MRKNIGTFRGKRKDNGELIEGFFTCATDCCGRSYFIDVPRKDPDDSNHRYEVDPETVCEFTGLTDKNGVKIFEGDILRSYLRTRKITSVVRIGYFRPDFFYDKADECGYKITKKIFGFHAFEIHDNEEMMLAADMSLACVIGNIHDNPELLGGAK